MSTNDLAETLSIEVPGCPLATIRDMLRWAQRELCTEGNAWIVRGEPVVVAADTDYAELEVPVGAEALRIMGLLSGWRRLRPGSDYYQTGPNAVSFRSRPGQSTLYGELACRPLPGADMPEELITRWGEPLMDGARYRLLMLPKPWRDPQLAEFHRRKFMDAQADARSLAIDGLQHGSIRMHARRVV